MDSVRYFLAVLLVVALPPGIAYWFLIHPFIGFWRKLGPTVTYAIVLAAFLAMIGGLFVIRDHLIVGDLGTNYALWPPAILSYGASVFIALRVRKYLTFRIFVGVPELAGETDKGKLLTEGIYGRVRHPRYVAVVLGVLAFALFTNYLSTYLMAPISMLGVYLLSLVEEKELRARFGEEYVSYATRVPRFVPRRGQGPLRGG